MSRFQQYLENTQTKDKMIDDFIDKTDANTLFKLLKDADLIEEDNISKLKIEDSVKAYMIELSVQKIKEIIDAYRS